MWRPGRVRGWGGGWCGGWGRRELHARPARPARVLFLGSDAVSLAGLAALDTLYKRKELISRLELVTANRSSNHSIIEKYALAENLNILPWPIQDLKTDEFDIGVVVSFGHLIPDRVITKFPLGMVNVHTSLLPRWRGAAPVVHTLLHGDPTTGVTLMKIRPHNFDVGEIISQQSIKVESDTTLPQLTSQLAELGALMLVRCMETLPHCLEEARPQSDEGITYARKIDKSICRVRWTEMSAIQVYNLHRAIFGVYPLTTTFQGRDLRLFGAFLDLNNSETIKNQPIGSVRYCKELSAIKVLCKDNSYVCFKSVRMVGKREISAFDFYNGYLRKTEGSIFQ